LLRKLQESPERSETGDQHDTKAHGHSQRDPIKRSFEVQLGDQFGHDEIPRGLSMSFRLITRHAVITQMLRLTQRIKRENRSQP
jgi:hypothetical protein